MREQVQEVANRLWGWGNAAGTTEAPTNLREQFREMAETLSTYLGKDNLYEVLSPLTLDAVRAEAIRAHLKHKDAGGSILDPRMPTVKRLAALGEEYGEVCEELTYDKEKGDTAALVKELIQVASVALTWVEFLEGASMVHRPDLTNAQIAAGTCLAHQSCWGSDAAFGHKQPTPPAQIPSLDERTVDPKAVKRTLEITTPGPQDGFSMERMAAENEGLFQLDPETAKKLREGSWSDTDHAQTGKPLPLREMVGSYEQEFPDDDSGWAMERQAADMQREKPWEYLDKFKGKDGDK